MNTSGSGRNTPRASETASGQPQQAVPSEDIPEDENLVDEPLADKSDVTAPMHDADDPVNNASGVPGVDPDMIEELREESQQEIDFSDGRIRDANLTQGRSVIDAEFDDRGPATHTHPDDENQSMND